jgi:hypothetical protein
MNEATETRKKRRVSSGLHGAAFLTLGLAQAAAGSAADADERAGAGFGFIAETVSTFVPSPGMGTGVAVADYDGDGDPDIFVPTGANHGNLVFRNRGDGTFDEVAAALELDDTRQARSALWLDYDGDGDLDLFVSRDCHIKLPGYPAAGSCAERMLSLFEQRGSAFVEVTDSVGLLATAGAVPDAFHSGGLSAADVSGDGLPDLYAARWLSPDELYISDTLFALGKAAGYTLGSGFTDIGNTQNGHWQGLFHDFDRDGRMDLFVNVDFTANRLWMNRGGLVLEDIASIAGVASSWNEMGLAGGDYDNDGDLDLFATNIFQWTGASTGSHNLLLRNDTGTGQVVFHERAVEAGVDDTGWGWGAVWLDADNDGDLDLAATNGYCQPDPPDICPDRFDDDPSRFFLQTAPGVFAEIGELVGFDDRLTGGGLVAADFDGDGRQDLLQVAIDPATSTDPLLRTERLTLYRNQSADSGGFLAVRPRMTGLNSHALGAELRLVLGDGTTLTRWIRAGESWMSQAPANAHFGLGTAAVDRLEIDWPSSPDGPGGTTVISSPAADAFVELIGPERLFSAGFEQ